MSTLYIALTLITAGLVGMSAVMKVKRNPQIVKVIHEVVGVPIEWLPVLAALEFAGALGLLAGMAWAPLGVAAGIGLVIYFTGAIVSHLRVGDFKGLGPATFMLTLAVGALVTRVMTMDRPA